MNLTPYTAWWGKRTLLEQVLLAGAVMLAAVLIGCVFGKWH